MEPSILPNRSCMLYANGGLHVHFSSCVDYVSSLAPPFCCSSHVGVCCMLWGFIVACVILLQLKWIFSRDLLFSQKNGYPRESGDSILGYEDLEASKKWVFDDPFSLSVGRHGYDEYCSPMTMNSGGGDGCLYMNW